jgi:hypothetical protein
MQKRACKTWNLQFKLIRPITYVWIKYMQKYVGIYDIPTFTFSDILMSPIFRMDLFRIHLFNGNNHMKYSKTIIWNPDPGRIIII